MNMINEGFLYQLVFMPRFFPVNCYLVEETDGLTLVDAAMPFSLKGILRAASSIGKPIARIVLTHAHADHVGALDGLKQLLPDVPVFISRRDSRLLGGDLSLEPGEPNTPIRGGVPKKLLTRASVLLQEGDRIGSLQAISTPGHTPGSMSFLDIRSRAIIAGDAMQTRGGVAVTGQVRPTFPFPAFATWNKEQALISARKIKECHPSLLAVGHGKMLHNPLDALDRAIQSAELHLNKLAARS